MMMPGLPEVASEYVATRMNARYAQNGIVTASTSRHGPGGRGSAGTSGTAPCGRRFPALTGPNRVRAATDEIMELFRPLSCGSPRHHAPAPLGPQFNCRRIEWRLRRGMLVRLE